MSSILKALKKLEQDPDTTLGMRAKIIVKSTDRPRIRSVIIQSLIIVTTIVIFAAVGFIINRQSDLSPRQSQSPTPAARISQKTMENAMLKTDQIRKESLPQQPVAFQIKTPIPMATTPSTSNEPAKPVDIIKKSLSIGIDAKTVKLKDAHTGVEKPQESPPKSKEYYSESIHSDVPAPTEIKINDNVGLKLQAISWSTNAKKRIVVINGQICREGEHVNGYVVKQINPSDVMVSNGSTSGKLSFKIR